MTLKLGSKHGVLEYYQVYSNVDPGLTLNYFTARSNLVPCDFIWEKGKIIDFSETFVVCDIKVGKCSYVNELMNLYEYSRSRSFNDLGSRSLRFSFANFFFLELAKPIEAQIHFEPPRDARTKVYSNGPGHMTKLAAI